MSLPEPIRLNKYIASSGICSRRKADELIAQGLIEVNGLPVKEVGSKVSTSDRVTYRGKPISPTRSLIYVLLNKPKGIITTTDDPQGRKTVMDLTSKATSERIYPVGRLDLNTTGVLLLTNDGELAKKLTHPSYQIQKVYSVTLDKPLTREDLKKLSEGITLEDGPIKADDISYLEVKSHIGVAIHSGRNRIVRRMFETLGYAVLKLDRTSFAGLTKKNLKRGGWRLLLPGEVRMLKNSVNKSYSKS